MKLFVNIDRRHTLSRDCKETHQNFNEVECRWRTESGQQEGKENVLHRLLTELQDDSVWQFLMQQPKKLTTPPHGPTI